MVGKDPQKILRISKWAVKQGSALVMVVEWYSARVWFSIVARLLTLKECEEFEV